MEHQFVNSVALTVNVSDVKERAGYRIGTGSMTFQPNNKPAFTVAVDIVAKADEKCEAAIVVGALNVMGKFAQKVRDVNG